MCHGLLARVWKRRKKITLHHSKVEAIVDVCAVLHNITTDRQDIFDNYYIFSIIVGLLSIRFVTFLNYK